VTDRLIVTFALAGTVAGSLVVRGWRETADVVLVVVLVGLVVAGVRAWRAD